MNKSLSLNHLQSIWSSHQKPIITENERYVKWDELNSQVHLLKDEILKRDERSWLLYTEEPEPFVIGFLALLYAGKNIHLPGVKPEILKKKNKLPILSDLAEISEIVILEKEQNNIGYTLEINSFEGVEIVLHTSGSSGQPKKVIKKLFQIENELKALLSLWGDLVNDSLFVSTVSHQHYYGFLFTILLPLISGNTIHAKKLHFPESLYSLIENKISLISSPAFLKRMESLEVKRVEKAKFSVFSSGGFLPLSTAKSCFSFFNSNVREIYGSTETGGIAWKESPKCRYWIPFDVVEIYTIGLGPLKIKSSYLENREIYELEDQIKMIEGNSFELLGRMDSIAKVEEKRVALNDIENRLLETELVIDVAVFVFQNNRQYIGAAIELNQKGIEKFKGVHKRDINSYFRKYLRTIFHPTVLPKKWRYPSKMPINSQGKILKYEVKKLFEAELCEYPEIHWETSDENSWDLELLFPENYRYFDGHFPEMKILPAVVQVDLVIKLVEEKLGHKISLDKIPRMKFKNPIFPNRKISLKISYIKEQSRLGFEYRSMSDSKTCSSGKIQIKENLK